MKRIILVAFCALIGASEPVNASAGIGPLMLSLPDNIQEEVYRARQVCVENKQFDSYYLGTDEGITRIDLNGDGSNDIIIDFAKASCWDGGCSAKGSCRIMILKATKPETYKTVLDLYVFQHFLSTDSKDRLKLLMVSPTNRPYEPCVTVPETERCDVVLTWKQGGGWGWLTIGKK